jgi:rod shape-determining protein MreB
MKINLIDYLRKIKLPFFTNFEIYFDLGTSITKIAIKDKGIILKESSFLAYNNKIKDYLFFGDEAKTIIGKTPDFIKIIRPVIAGVISDFDAEVSLLKKFLERSVYLYFSKQLVKPLLTAVAITPSIATEIEQKAVEEALLKAGMAQVYLIEKPLATATGCGINIFSNQPYLIVDLGGGLFELTIVGSGGIIAQKTLKNAGEAMNKTIYNYLYLKYGLILGEATCEELKTTLLNFSDEEKILTIRGKSLETGLPKSVKIKSSDIKESLLTNFNQLVDAIKELIESSPPEVVDEILRNGIILAGGLAKTKGIDKFIADEIKIKTMVAENPDLATIIGLMKIRKNPDSFSKLIINQ